MLAFAPPMAHHPGLREREGEENADRVERDQTVRVAAEGDDEQAGEER